MTSQEMKADIDAKIASGRYSAKTICDLIELAGKTEILENQILVADVELMQQGIFS